MKIASGFIFLICNNGDCDYKHDIKLWLPVELLTAVSSQTIPNKN